MQQSSFEFAEAVGSSDAAAANSRFQEGDSSRESAETGLQLSIHLSKGGTSTPGSGLRSVRPNHRNSQNRPSRKTHSANLSRRSPGSNSEMHLAAARRLSREIRRTHYHSPEATRTGRLVCRHLVAMLQQNRLQQKQAGAKQEP